MEHFIIDLHLAALTHYISWLINALFFSNQMQGLWPNNVMLCHGQTVELRVAVSATLLEARLRKAQSTHPQRRGVCQSAVSISICVLLMKHHLSPSAVVRHREWSSLSCRWEVGELWEGAPPAHPWAGSAQRWETRRQPARNPCTGGRELFSPLSSALLLAGKCAFKAQLTKEEQENKMQIRGEINFRRFSFVIMTQLFRGRQHSFGSIKGTSPYPLMNSFLSVPLDVWGGHRFAWHQSCLPTHLPVAITKANKIQKSSCCFLHSAGYQCLVVTSVSVVTLMGFSQCLCPQVHYTCSVFHSQNTNMGPQLHPYPSKQLFVLANKNSLWFFQPITQDGGIAKYLLPRGVDSSGVFSNITQ